jgi:cytochrome c oxidase subunit 4
MEKQNHYPFSTYILVWIALLLLTVLTVTVASLKLGAFSVYGAILIAALKSSLVVLLFMKIKYEDRVFKIMVAVAVVMLTIIISFTFLDIAFR